MKASQIAIKMKKRKVLKDALKLMMKMKVKMDFLYQMDISQKMR